MSLKNSAEAFTDLEVCECIARYTKGSVLNVMIELIEPMTRQARLSRPNGEDIGRPPVTTGHPERLTDQSRAEFWRGVRGGASP
jgi:hypothetical protein